MIKNNKWKIIVSLIITLLPLFAGLILWNKLPDQIATHFDFHGQPNGWTGKNFTVFGIPVFLLFFQIICIIIANDPKKNYMNVKTFRFVIWIIPVCSLIIMFTCYGYALH